MNILNRSNRTNAGLLPGTALALVAVLAVIALLVVHAPRTTADSGTGSGAWPAAYQVPRTASMSDPQVARGAYLVTVLACTDCHTPLKLGPNGPEPDVTRFLSGHPEGLVITSTATLPEGPWLALTAMTGTAFAGPWGTSFSANLTPDEATGIGAWTEEIFVNTLRSGRHWGQSRPILPPMPWQSFGQMTDEDLKAVYAYLRTLPPLHNRVPEPLPPPGMEPEVAGADPFVTDERTTEKTDR